jgi:ribose/xylose/arabinose/galactoside ABC-type transport system permease subunit
LARSSPHFLKTANLINVIRQLAIVGLIGIGMTFVILTTGADLPVGSRVGFVAALSASMLRAEARAPPSTAGWLSTAA